MGMWGRWEQLSILVMDMIMTFLWLQRPLKSVNFLYYANCPRTAYVNEGGGGLILCLLSQNPYFFTTITSKLVDEILSRLCTSGMRLSQEKSKYFEESVVYLGFVVSRGYKSFPRKGTTEKYFIIGGSNPHVSRFLVNPLT